MRGSVAFVSDRDGPVEVHAAGASERGRAAGDGLPGTDLGEPLTERLQRRLVEP